VAQRQHRIGSGFTWRKRWPWLCSGHGSKSFFIVPLRRDQPARSHDRVPMGREGEIRAAIATSAPKGQVQYPVSLLKTSFALKKLPGALGRLAPFNERGQERQARPLVVGCSTETGSDAGKVFLRASSSASSWRLRLSLSPSS